MMYPTHERICLWRPAKAVAVPVLYEASNFGSLAAANGETVRMSPRSRRPSGIASVRPEMSANA
jgi:hypothetical protein